MLDSLSRYPEVNNAETLRIAGALLLAERARKGLFPARCIRRWKSAYSNPAAPDAVVAAERQRGRVTRRPP